MRKMYLLLVSLALSSGPAAAWWGDGHGILTRAAFLALPGDVPAFFREGGAWAAHISYDADLFKNRALTQLDRAEHSEHFLDLELLEGRSLPENRYAFIALCEQLGVEPQRVGFAPYAIAEWTGRLAIAFAEHRKWPENETVRAKCLVYAGHLAHYAQDLCQPLHVTIHFDGRKLADGTVVGQGIHEQVDASVEKFGFTPESLAAGQKPAALESPMGDIVRMLQESHALVDSVYALQGRWADVEDGQAVALARERGRAAAHFTAALYLTAWRQSADVRLPGWLQR